MQLNSRVIFGALLALVFAAASVWLLLMGLLFVALGSPRPEWAAPAWGFVWFEISRFVWCKGRALFGAARTAKKRGMFRKIWLGCGRMRAGRNSSISAKTDLTKSFIKNMHRHHRPCWRGCRRRHR